MTNKQALETAYFGQKLKTIVYQEDVL